MTRVGDATRGRDDNTMIMKDRISFSRPPHAGLVCALLVSLAVLASSTASCIAAEPAQATYSSAAEASRALFEAVQSGDLQAVQRVLGVHDELLSSEDEATEQRERAQFMQKYEQMHRLVKQSDGTVLLSIGAENWPFPVPLVQRDGAWSFDSESGLREVLFRRIGNNEMTAIDVCRALVDVQQRGIHESTRPDAPDSFLSAVLATQQNGNQPVRFHGYEFRVLENSGKRFAVLVYPAEYRSSGVMSFLLDRDSKVYERDLGPQTAQLASALTLLHRDRKWVQVSLRPE